MCFLSNLLDAIPVVGHIKGIVHYACGDTEGGDKAMYQATRTLAVLGAGAVGSLAAPGGAVAAAIIAGAVIDGVASVAMDKPQGLIKSIKNIADDLKEGNNPTDSILSTGFQIGMDGLGGLGMGGVYSVASQISKTAVAKSVENIAKSAVKTVGENTIQKTVKMTVEEVVKTATKTVTEKAVNAVIKNAAVQANVGFVLTHVLLKAAESTKEEAREQLEREERQIGDRQERKQQERRAREQQTQRARKQLERWAREQRRQRPIGLHERQKRRAREQQERQARDQYRQRPRGQQQNCGSPGGSSQPPGRNNNNQSRYNEFAYYYVLIKLLEQILKEIYGDAETTTRTNMHGIFKRLSQGQQNYLNKIVLRLMKAEMLKEVLTLVIKIFCQHLPESISFPNFLSLIEFVAVYIQEEIDYRSEDYRMGEMTLRENDSSIPRMTPWDLRDRILSDIMNLANIVNTIVDIFVKLRFDIESELATFDLSPNFRDIFSAIYHYFKHRCVPGDGVLSVREYYEWTKRVLERLGRRQEYRDLLQDQRRNVRANVVFEMYVVEFGRRFRIVVELRNNTIVLASAFVLDDTNDGDQEGMESIRFL